MKKKATKKVVRTRVARGPTLDSSAMAAAAMLLDPCNATLAPSAFRGDQGFRTRFVSNNTVASGAGFTCGAIAFIPGQNLLWVMEAATASTSVAWVNLSTFAPGNTFLATNAIAYRSLGACLSSTPIAANLAVSGQVYTGIVTVSSLGIPGSTTASSLAQLCNNYAKVTIDQPMETKFVPGALDEEYFDPSTVDSSDSNAILQVYIGLPAATGVTYRMTNIAEWKSLPNKGLVSESYLGNPSRNTIEHVKEYLRTRNPSWWTNIGMGAYSVIRGYATKGVMGAIGAASRLVKTFVG